MINEILKKLSEAKPLDKEKVLEIKEKFNSSMKKAEIKHLKQVKKVQSDLEKALFNT